MSITPQISPPEPRLEVVYSGGMGWQDKLERKIDRLALHIKGIWWAFGVAVTAFGIASGFVIYSHVPALISAQLTPIMERLGKIDGRLLKIDAANNPTEALQQIAEYDQENFAHTLPALQTVVEKPVSEVGATPATLREISTKLLRVKIASQQPENYWPIALRFLQFASTKVAPSSVPARGEGIMLEISKNKGNLSLGTVSDKVVLLDGGELVDTTFIRCRIIFTQDPVKLRNVKFEVCIFEMPTVQRPTQYLQDASQQLLASNLRSINELLR